MEELTICFSPDDIKNEKSFKGYIYEWYGYNYLLTRIKSISIVKSKYNITDTSIDNYFSYANKGNVVYTIGSCVFCEFDVLGVKGKTIYLWEITRNKTDRIHKNIKRKLNLLKLIFPDYKINIDFIIPKDLKCYKNYDRVILPEPEYSEYLSTGKFVISDYFYRCIPLSDFVKHSNNNSLIKEIIYLSLDYFKNKVYKQKKYHEEIINRLYDIDNIFSDEFKSYNFDTKKVEIIKAVDNKYFVNDNELTNPYSNIIDEIKKLIRAN